MCYWYFFWIGFLGAINSSNWSRLISLISMYIRICINMLILKYSFVYSSGEWISNALKTLSILRYYRGPISKIPKKPMLIEMSHKFNILLIMFLIIISQICTGSWFCHLYESSRYSDRQYELFLCNSHFILLFGNLHPIRSRKALE